MTMKKKKKIRMVRELLPWALIVSFMATIIAVELARAVTGPADRMLELKERCDSLEIELLQMKNENRMMAVNPYYFDEL